MSVITVVIPTYNEELNIEASYERVKKVFDENMKEHSFQIVLQRKILKKLLIELTKRLNHRFKIFVVKKKIIKKMKKLIL